LRLSLKNSRRVNRVQIADFGRWASRSWEDFESDHGKLLSPRNEMPPRRSMRTSNSRATETRRVYPISLSLLLLVAKP
jgi:hypothetical protein